MALARAVGVDGHVDEVAQHVLPWRDAVVVRRLRSGLDPDRRGGRALRSVTGGLADHATLRMLAVDAAVERGVAAGCRQLVVLGAGLDTRAWRLPALASTRVIELDLPSTQEDKRRRLAGIEPTAAEVRFVPADLDRVDLDWVLGDAGHDAGQPTTWVAEGVVMYLHHEATAAMLATAGRRSAVGSRIAVSSCDPRLLGDSPVGRRLEPAAHGLFAVLGEPLRSLHGAEEVRLLLSGAGFSDVALSGSHDWASAAGLRPPPVDAFAAERLAQAVRA